MTYRHWRTSTKTVVMKRTWNRKNKNVISRQYSKISFCIIYRSRYGRLRRWPGARGGRRARTKRLQWDRIKAGDEIDMKKEKKGIGVGTAFVRGKWPLGSGFFQTAIHAGHNSGSATEDGPRNGHWKWIDIICTRRTKKRESPLLVGPFSDRRSPFIAVRNVWLVAAILSNKQRDDNV